MSSPNKPPPGSRQDSLSSNSLSPDAEPWNITPSHPLDTTGRRNHPSGAIPRNYQRGSQGDCVSSPSSTAYGNIQPENRGGSSEIVTGASRGDCQNKISSDDYETSPHQTTKEAMQAVIDKYRDLMPPELQVEYYDVMILYSEEDREAAEEYKRHLMEEIMLEKGHSIKAVLYDDQEMVSLAGSKIKGLEKSFQRCTFAFVFLTKAFCECEWCAFSSEECLMEAIYNPQKKWCVVPVYTVQRNKADFKIPMGLNSLKGVNYYNNDQFYQRGLKRLIGDKLHVRINSERKHFENQYEWACEERNKQEILEVQRQQLIERKERQNQEMRRMMHSRSNPGNLTEHSEKTDSYYLQNIMRSKSEHFKSLSALEESHSILSKPESAYASLSAKSTVTEHSMRQPSEGDDGCHFSLDDSPSLDNGPRSTDSGLSVDAELPNYGTSTNTSPYHQQKLTSTQHTSRTPNTPSTSIVVHEHHHYYEPQPNPTQATVINYNIEGASNVVVGKGGTIISGSTSEESVVIEDNTRPKQSSTSPVRDPSTSIPFVSRPVSRPSIDSPTSKTSKHDSQQTEGKTFTDNNKNDKDTDSQLLIKRGVRPVCSVTSTNTTEKDMAPSSSPSSGVPLDIKKVAQVSPMPRGARNRSPDSQTSLKTTKDPVPTETHPLDDDEEETGVKGVRNEDFHETKLKPVDNQYRENPYEGEQFLDSQTGCKVVSSGSVGRTPEVETTLPLSRSSKEKQTSELCQSDCRLSETSLETDSGEVSGEARIDQRDRTLVSRCSDTPEGFVKVSYGTDSYSGTDVDVKGLTAEEKKLSVVSKTLEMGFEEYQVKSALEKLKREEPGHVKLTVDDLVNEIVTMTEVPPTDHARGHQHRQENVRGREGPGRNRSQRDSNDSAQQSEGILSKMKKLFNRK